MTYLTYMYYFLEFKGLLHLKSKELYIDDDSLLPELHVAVLDSQRCKVAAAIFPLGAVEENCVL
jgi:hypothetical protein